MKPVDRKGPLLVLSLRSKPSGIDSAYTHDALFLCEEAILAGSSRTYLTTILRLNLFYLSQTSMLLKYKIRIQHVLEKKLTQLLERTSSMMQYILDINPLMTLAIQGS